MKKHFAATLTFALVLILPLMGLAQSVGRRHSIQAKMAASMYVCPICHHKANAALAKRIHYICPVDGGKLVLVKPAKK